MRQREAPACQCPQGASARPLRGCHLRLVINWNFGRCPEGKGGEEGGKSKILSQRGGKVRYEKGQKKGRQRLCLHQVGLFGVRP